MRVSAKTIKDRLTKGGRIVALEGFVVRPASVVMVQDHAEKAVPAFIADHFLTKSADTRGQTVTPQQSLRVQPPVSPRTFL